MKRRHPTPITKLRNRGTATETTFADALRPVVVKASFLNNGDPPEKDGKGSPHHTPKRNTMMKAGIARNSKMWNTICKKFSHPSIATNVVKAGLNGICLENQKGRGMPDKKVDKWVAVLVPRYKGQAAY